MSAPADLVIYVAIVAALWIAYIVRKSRRGRGKPRLGDADAYEGNLIIPLALGRHRGVTTHEFHGSGHTAHGGGHAAHGPGHAGHGAIGSGHH